MTGSTALAEVLPANAPSAFSGAEAFRNAMTMAESLSRSQLVPKEYHGKPDDCLLALEISQRLQASPLMVMQSLDIIHGRPSWRSQFVIAGINRHPRFAGSLNWKWTGERDKDSWGAVAYIRERETGELLEGPEVTIAIAKKEGWYSRNGSKWQTIPELMLKYRSASWFANVHCPEVKLGIMTQEEAYDVRDMGDADVVSRAPAPPRRKSEATQEKPDGKNEAHSENTDKQKSRKTKGEKKDAPAGTVVRGDANHAGDDQGAGRQPDVDAMIREICEAETEGAVYGVMALADGLSKDDKQRVLDCSRQRIKELRNGGGSSEPQNQQDSLNLPGNYGDE